MGFVSLPIDHSSNVEKPIPPASTPAMIRQEPTPAAIRDHRPNDAGQRRRLTHRSGNRSQKRLHPGHVQVTRARWLVRRQPSTPSDVAPL